MARSRHAAAQVMLCALAKVHGGGSYVWVEDVTVALGDTELILSMALALHLMSLHCHCFIYGLKIIFFILSLKTFTKVP